MYVQKSCAWRVSSVELFEMVQKSAKRNTAAKGVSIELAHSIVVAQRIPLGKSQAKCTVYHLVQKNPPKGTLAYYFRYALPLLHFKVSISTANCIINTNKNSLEKLLTLILHEVWSDKMSWGSHLESSKLKPELLPLQGLKDLLLVSTHPNWKIHFLKLNHLNK